MAGGWIERKDDKGNIIQRIREEDAKLFYRRNRFERGYCEVWTSEYKLMTKIIRENVTCKILGLSLVPELMDMMQFDTGNIVVDQTKLAKELGATRENINKTLREFVELGLLNIVGKESRHTIYRLPEHVVWKGRPESRMKVIAGGLEKEPSPSEPSAEKGAAAAPGGDPRSGGKPRRKAAAQRRSDAATVQRDGDEFHPR